MNRLEKSVMAITSIATNVMTVAENGLRFLRLTMLKQSKEIWNIILTGAKRETLY